MIRGYECPECGGENKGGTFVLGWHYCSECDLAYTDSGEAVGRGRTGHGEV